MDNITSFLIYIAEFKVLICTTCGYALKSTSTINNHIYRYHDNNTQELAELAQNGDIINSLEILNNPLLITPKFNTYYYEFLPVYNCFKCTKCDLISTNYKAIRQHLNKQHNIKSNTTTSTYYTQYILEVKCQTFYNQKNLVNYFIIKDENQLNLNLNPKFDINPLVLISNYNTINKKLNNNYTISNNDPRELDNFLYNTYFLNFLQEKDLNWLFIYIKPLNSIDDSANYNVLSILNTSVINLLSNNTDIINILAPFYLQALNTEHFNFKEDTNYRAFKKLDSNNNRYYSIISNYFIFIIRNILANYPIVEIKANIKANPYISKLLDNLTLYNVTNLSNISNKIEKQAKLDQIQANINSNIILAFTRFITLNNTQDSFTNIPFLNNSIIIFIILSNFNIIEKRFKKPIELEQFLSRIIYNIRYIFLLYLKQIQLNNPSVFNLDVEFFNFRNKYLVNNQISVFYELVRLRSIMRKLDLNTNKEARITVINNNILAINNIRIKLDCFISFYSILLDKLESMLLRDLLFIDKYDTLEPKLINIINNIQDDTSIERHNSYFINNANNNQNLEPYLIYLLLYINNNPNIAINWFISKANIKSTTKVLPNPLNNDVYIRTSAYNTYERNINEFIKLL